VNGAMRLCAVNSQVMEVFQACQMDSYFKFAQDQEAAVAELASQE
jgi:anti-anti-sigma regulatory factor